MGEHNHPEVSMHTYALAEYMKHVERDDWDGVAYLMSRSATKLADIGAEFAICPDNTFHQAFDKAAEASPVPWLHIAGEVARDAVAKGYRTLGVTGTAYLMAGPVYPRHLGQAGIEMMLPDDADRELISTAIFERLVKGEFNDEDRAAFVSIFEKLKEAGCDAVVMGCTEIPILMDGVETPLPTLDSTRLLARAALQRAQE